MKKPARRPVLRSLANNGIDLVFVFFNFMIAGHFANIFTIVEEQDLGYTLEGETVEEVAFVFNIYMIEAEFALVIFFYFFQFRMNGLADMAALSGEQDQAGFAIIINNIIKVLSGKIFHSNFTPIKN
jgi:hypothetical protein